MPCPLSFYSCALANIPHQFLMHYHMVVLFFFSGAVTNEYEEKKNNIWSNKKRVSRCRHFHVFSVVVAFGSISWWSKCFKRFLKTTNYKLMARAIWWQTYGPSSVDVFDVGYRPSMWGDIQSCRDGRPVPLCPEWSSEMIFLMLSQQMSFTGLRCSLLAKRVSTIACYPKQNLPKKEKSDLSAKTPDVHNDPVI